MTRSTVARLARYAITLAIIALLIVFARTVDWAEAWTSMRSASPALLAAALVANLASLACRAIRWSIFLRASGARSLGLATRATVAGAGLNNVLVANGGEAARVVFITRATGIPASQVLATVALDRLFDPVGFVALLAAGIVLFDFPPEIARFKWTAIALLVLIAALLTWLTIRARKHRPPTVPTANPIPMGWPHRILAWITAFVRSMGALATGQRIFWVLVLTMLAWFAQLATFAFAAAAAHVSLPVAGSLATLLATNVSLIVRATPGNVGFFQFAYAIAAAPFGVNRDRAIAVSILIQTLQIIPVTLLGVALAPEFIFRRRNAITDHNSGELDDGRHTGSVAE